VTSPIERMIAADDGDRGLDPLDVRGDAVDLAHV
jgi:hypothetical protein